MRKASALALALTLALAACESGDSGVKAGGTTTSSSAAVTSSTVATTVPGTTVGSTRPTAGRPRTPPVDVTASLATVGTYASFEALAAEIIAAIERRHPSEEGSSVSTSSSATSTNSSGTVVVRREGFADDSVAGVEYIVMVEEGNSGWAVVSATRSDICYRGVSGAVCA